MAGFDRLRQAARTFFDTDDKPRPKSNLAQLGSAVIAVTALGGIWYQVSLARFNTLQASARQVYMSYTQATLQHPELAYPNYKKLKDDQNEMNRYKIYVGMMLTAYDEIISLDLGPEWMAAFKYDIADHMEYLCGLTSPLYWQTFQKKTRELVEAEKKLHCRQFSGPNHDD